MSNAVSELSPTELWKNFSDLNAIPRASKKEERVIQFIIDFGKKLNLQTYKDEVGNVIIKKPASPGMENKVAICLQSHLDMVHQKNGTTAFDFATQGINMFIDDDWVKAKGTTLGADNGIGVASIMTILASDHCRSRHLGLGNSRGSAGCRFRCGAGGRWRIDFRNCYSHQSP